MEKRAGGSRGSPYAPPRGDVPSSVLSHTRRTALGLSWNLDVFFPRRCCLCATSLLRLVRQGC